MAEEARLQEAPLHVLSAVGCLKVAGPYGLLPTTAGSWLAECAKGTKACAPRMQAKAAAV